MIVKKKQDQVVIDTKTCGQIREILRVGEYEAFDFALAINIKPTVGHYHNTFEEIYLVMDGVLKIRFFEPDSSKTWEDEFEANELVVIKKGVHHRIVQTSIENRLGVISVPRFDIRDETLSDRV